MSDTVLDVRDLRVEFPTRNGVLTALDGVSLSISRGEILGVVGESGAGKSMTGLAILGLLSGDRIDTLSEREMEDVRGGRIGAIFQDPLTSLNPLFRVGDQLVETIRLHTDLGKDQARARALALLREVGIPAPENRIDAYPHQFSGGMRQRVVIALALCAEPELIVADEPTTALDVSIQAQITALLRQLCHERGTAVMLVTHDMGVIAETADRVAVMYAGRIAEMGSVEEVVRRPRHPYTEGLMASIPTMHRDVEELRMIPGAMPRLDAIPEGCAFNPRCAHAGPRCRREVPRIEGAGAACWLALEGATA
jgi:peptide/nickel transport system ATP-binding protein